MELYNLVSFLGMFVLMGIAWLFSTHRKTINWHLIGFGLGIQLLFALFMFTVPGGTTVFLWINDLVVKVLDSASAGTRFLFGRLA
ncbi:MAG: Na+ dependent nucleoside transporter N-terminal domain-containing protein, partial [candidate division KSB1 bacterium]|nr:Na+ dependent nucleoside transporter N-terminal domain-containing protein [candidate division KSB1 bacterium]